MNMKKRLLLVWLALICLAVNMVSAAPDIQGKIRTFNEQTGKERIAQANALMLMLLEEGFGDAVAFDEQTPADTVTMTVNYYAAEYLIAMGDYPACIAAAQIALPLAEHNGDYTWKSETLNLLMLASFYQSHYVDALHYAEQALQVEAAHQDYERMSSTLNTTAGIYLGARQPWQAEQYIVKAIEADQKTTDHAHANAIYGIAGEVYMGIGEYDKALRYTQMAYDMEMQRGNTVKAAIRQSQMASLYVVLNDTARAHQLAGEALQVLTQAQVMPSLGICYNTLGDVMRLEGRTDEAARYFNIAHQLFLQTGDLYNRSHALQGMARVLKNVDPQQSLTYLEHFAALKDTIYYNDMKMLLSNYSAKFRNDELTTENTVLSTENSALTAQNKTNRTLVIAGIIVVVLMLLALGFLIYAIRLKSKSNRFLLDLQHTRENFFTNITHEFRTPLTVILGLSRQLADNADTTDAEKIKTSTLMIEREGSQLLLLINQLLDLTKVQANAMQPDWRTDNVIAYLNMVMETFYDYAHTQGVELLYAPRENEVVMDFVPDYMQKIVNNLLSNAVKFTPQGGHVRVTTRSEHQQLVLQVADDGIGIKRSQLPHIFEPFYQADGDGQHLGTGVGLSLVRQIVTSVGGTIEVASSQGKGTVFTVRLPLSQGRGTWQSLSSSEQPQQVVPVAGHEDTTNSLVDSETSDSSDRTRILIIEDNRDVAYYIGSQLSDRYEIFYATNGQMGLEKAERLVPDLILSDLMMPGIDGLEVCRRVRTNELLSHIPIIIITARSANDDVVKGIEAGADAYLVKPFNATELKVRVDKLLEQRRLLREKMLRRREEGATPVDEQNARFIGRLTDVVYSLMGRSQVDVDSVASTLCLSPSQLRRKLQAITGKTPAAYFLQIRLSNACRLLDKNPELSIGEVAFRCGFTDQAHFSHAFQKAYNMSPSQWAKRAK